MKELEIPESSFPRNNTFLADEIQTLTGTGAILNDGLGPKWMVWKRRRYLIVIMAFFGEVTKEVLRTNLSVTIFAMTENHTTTEENGNTVYVQDFDWDANSRGQLLSTFYYGIISTHLLGGILALKYGGSKLYGLGVALTATSTLLTPLAAYIHFYFLVSLRIFEGMCEGLLKPSLELIFAKWIPMNERSSLVAIVVAGNAVGVVFGIALSSAVSYHFHWSTAFYLTGGLAIIWYIAWVLLVKDNPNVDKRISPSEVKYIQGYILNLQQQETKMSSIPFAKILTSIPLLALICGYIPVLCTYALFSTQLPAYINDVLKLEYQNSGYMTSLSFTVYILAIICFSPLADRLINREVLSTSAVRKIYICGGLTAMGWVCILIQHATSVTSVTGCLLFISLVCGPAFVQVIVNMLDLSARYSSVQNGILYTIAGTCAMLIIVLTGYLTQNKTAEEWHIVFSIVAGSCLLAAAIYGVFGSGKPQSWTIETAEITEDTT